MTSFFSLSPQKPILLRLVSCCKAFRPYFTVSQLIIFLPSPTIIFSQYPLPYDRLTEAYLDSSERGVNAKGLVGLEVEVELERTKELGTNVEKGIRWRTKVDSPPGYSDGGK